MLSMALARSAARKLEERVAAWRRAALRVCQRERGEEGERRHVSSTARHVGRRGDACAVKEFNVGEQYFIAFSCRRFARSRLRDVAEGRV